MRWQRILMFERFTFVADRESAEKVETVRGIESK